jgi:hypothetical protein
MKANHTTLEALTVERAEAAVPVALRHGVGDRWLELELDLWRVLTATVKRWGREALVSGSEGK